MVRALLLLTLGLVAPALAAPPDVAGMQRLPEHVGGRVQRIGGIDRHEWPGIYVEARFTGRSLALAFDDALNSYRLTIDGREQPPIRAPGHATIALAPLGPGLHRVRLDKVTESSGFVGGFAGFFVPRGHALPAPPARARQIEFIGDSSMSGYGDTSTTIVCTPEEVRLRTDTTLAYPVLVARALDADYQINAISGRGLIRNYGGFAPGQAMQQLYPRLLPSRPGDYADPAWWPQVIVIKLNADFVGGAPRAGEAWADTGALAVDYINAYARFVVQLHRRAPDAAILIWWFDLGPNATAADHQFVDGGRAAIARAAHDAGVERIDFLPTAPLIGVNDACDHHGSLADHARTAAWLVRYLRAHPEDWRGH